MLLFFLIEPFLEGVEDHTVSSLDLTVSSRVSDGNVFNRDAPVLAEVPKMMAGKSCPEVGDDAVRETESVYDVLKELDCFLAVAATSGLYSIHLENLSMATYTYRKPPGAGLKGSIISSPQHANGQEAGMVCNSCAGTCICLAKN